METARNLAERTWEAIESADLAVLGDLFHEDAEFSTSAGAGSGLDYVRRVFSRHREGYPDLRHEVVDAVESADGSAAALRLTFTGTQLGELRGPFGAIAPTAKRLRWNSSDHVQARDGRIVSWHAHFDRLGIWQQLTGPGSSGGPGNTSPHKAVLRRVLSEAFEQGDVDVLDELVTEDFVNHRVPPGLGPGIDGVKRIVSVERVGFPDLKYTVEHEVEEGDFVIQVAMAEGTHQGTIFGVPPTGKRVSWRQVHVARIADGRMAEHWGVSDLASLWIQIGRAAPIAPVPDKPVQRA